MNKPKLKLVGEDGNAFAILGRASAACRKAGVDFTPIRIEATSGDYDHLLQTMMKYFDCDGDSSEEDDECYGCGYPENECECEEY